MTPVRIWIEDRKATFAVRWHSNGMTRIQTCQTEEEARAFAAGLEEGLAEAVRIIVDMKPRFADSAIKEQTA